MFSALTKDCFTTRSPLASGCQNVSLIPATALSSPSTQIPFHPGEKVSGVVFQTVADPNFEEGTIGGADAAENFRQGAVFAVLRRPVARTGAGVSGRRSVALSATRGCIGVAPEASAGQCCPGCCKFFQSV